MNELRKEYHNKTAGQIGEKARDLQTSYFTDEYVFWLEDQLKQLRISSVIPILSQEIECVCGWEGKKGNLYYREESKEFNIGAKLECPKCYAELISEPN